MFRALRPHGRRWPQWDGVTGIFSKKKSGHDYFIKGLAALKLDRWDEAWKEFVNAENAFFRAGGKPEKVGLEPWDLVSILITLGILDAASGYTERAVDRLKQGLKASLADRDRKVVEGVLAQIQNQASELPVSPYRINGRSVPLYLYVAKEVLMAEIGGSGTYDDVMTRILNGLAGGFFKNSDIRDAVERGDFDEVQVLLRKHGHL